MWFKVLSTLFFNIFLASVHKDASKWASNLIDVSKKESSKIFHVMSWNIPRIFIFHVVNLKWHGKIFHDNHGIFRHVTCMICFGINNGLLIMNMGLVSKALKCNMMWRFEGKKKIEGCISSSLVQPIFQMSRALGQYYNTFKKIHYEKIMSVVICLMQLKNVQ
jgi:hypothetical protein